MQSFLSFMSRLIVWCVLLFAAVVIANEAVFRLRVGSEAWNGSWKGAFSSTMQPVSGHLLVDLPDPLPRNEPFEFEAVIYYNIWSLFRTGNYARLTFTGKLQSEETVSTETESRQIRVPRQFSFKSRSGGGLPDIVYTATIGPADTYIAGSYMVGDGVDIGTIELVKR